MAISFQNPWMLLLLLPAALLLGRYSGRRRYLKEARPLVLACRSLLFCLLILALAQPGLVKTFKGQSIVYLLDQSRSVESAPELTGWINESLASAGPADQGAILGFAQNSRLLKPFTMERLATGSSTDVNPDFTAIEGALKAASSLFPAASNRRILLISDGQETDGDSLNFARTLAVQNIPVDILPIEVEPGEEVAVLDLILPRQCHPEQQVLVEIALQSTVGTRAELSLFWGGALVYQEPVSLAAGRQSFTIPVTVSGEGFQPVQAVIEPEEDTWLQNNQMRGLTFVEAPPRVLIAEGAGGKGTALHQSLLAGGTAAELIPCEQLPSSLAGLANYQAIYLVDVPAYRLPEQQQENLESFVKTLGGGLVAIGGKNSFGLGLYQDTPLENLLPVKMEVEEQEEMPGLDLVLVIDRSGSMSGEKINMAKNAALTSLDMLKERDRLAIITFNDQYQLHLPPTAVTAKEEIEELIAQISAGGGTIIHPALEEAVDLIADSSKSKHIILLSDGQEGATFSYTTLINKMINNNISLSTIGLGGDADQSFMQRLADRVDGRYYNVPRSADLPGIFLQETTLAGGDYLVEEEFRPTVVDSSFRAFATAKPLFTGYVASTPKPLAEVLLATHREHPLLSRWQYGLGRAIAFNSDSFGLWSSEFLSHPDFSTLWADSLSWVVPQFTGGDLALDVRLSGGGAEISALAGEPLGEGESIQVTVMKEDQEPQELALKPEGDNRYSTRLEGVTEGIYLFSAARTANKGTIDQAIGGFAIPYSPEFQIPSTSGRELLEEIATLTGGRILKNPREVFSAPFKPVRRTTDITFWLLLAAALLWPADIALRRFGLALPAPGLKSKPSTPPVQPESEQPKESTLDRLLEAKKRERM
ncbi:MAG: VWA domain-containing protein [Firmicutes bacterium]|nr:VWA domain-containing protein [Bacillota bacterium]